MGGLSGIINIIGIEKKKIFRPVKNINTILWLSILILIKFNQCYFNIFKLIRKEKIKQKIKHLFQSFIN